MRALVDSRFKRHFALAETHPRKMSDKKHYVNCRDLHVDFTNYPLYPGGSIPIPRCRIYGLRRDLKKEVVDGNLRYRPFSEAGFIEDLRTAAGVVASAGFTLMGEAVYLRRPMLAVPIVGQFEQVLNARYLEREGFGMAADAIDDQRLHQFIEALPEFERNLGRYRQDGNRDLLASLEKTLAAAVSKRSHWRRSP
jgi:hypothetical protein